MFFRLVPVPAGPQPVKLGLVFSAVLFSVTCDVSVFGWFVLPMGLLVWQTSGGGCMTVRQLGCVVMAVENVVALCLCCCFINENGLLATCCACCFHPCNE